MRVEEIPFSILFPESDGHHKAVLRAVPDGDDIRFLITAETPFLQRMGWDDDNSISVTIDGKSLSFRPSGKGDIPFSTEILENNNKRSRYRISFSVPVRIPFELEARAEGLEII